MSWVLSGVYASPNVERRRQLWWETTEVINTALPNICGGDFNTLLWASDKRGGARFRVTSEVEEFRHWVDYNQIQELIQHGALYTWCNNRRGVARVWEKLDRIFATASWMERFPTAMVSVLPRHCSDHAPLLLQTEIAPPTGRRPFRFERVWLEYPDLHDEIEKAWIGNLRSSPMGGLQRKLWTLQERLRGWNRRRVGDLPQRVQQAQNTLDKLMIEEQRSNSDFDYCVQLRQATNHLTALERQLEIFWAQRARQAWVREGDRNTRYFHQKVLRRRSRNRLEILRTESGELLHGDINVKSYVVKYFEDHWRSRVDSVSQIPPELIRRHLSSEMAEELVKPFTDEEIERYHAFTSYSSGSTCINGGENRPCQCIRFGGMGEFVSATPAQCEVFRQILTKAQTLTGLTVSYTKSSLKFSPSIPIRFCRWMSRIWRMPIASTTWHYLGVPISDKHSMKLVTSKPTLVSEMLGTKYHWNGNPWEFHIPQRAAAIWRALCMGLRALRTHVRKVAGTPSEIDLIRDPWLAPVPFSRIPTFLNMEYVRLDYRLSDVIDIKGWRHEIICNIFPPFWSEIILNSTAPVSDNTKPTQWVWDESPYLTPHLKEVYYLLLPSPFAADTQKLCCVRYPVRDRDHRNCKTVFLAYAAMTGQKTPCCS
ncbi:hypothetical protein QJS10_CPA01g01152 [Acorus calamus]|uniref:Endonuclease/exonuclease/phosphatase domain-containing protein n=1 Tax=Acorus calamus TaxID=4465 RepID=A0AAV9FLR7_ACOCL|nr:hypothetical protein QJS10_CPA01g01152 [Acorus calamus]